MGVPGWEDVQGCGHVGCGCRLGVIGEFGVCDMEAWVGMKVHGMWV